MFKRVFAILLAVLMLGGLTSCLTVDQPTTETTEDTLTTDTPNTSTEPEATDKVTDEPTDEITTDEPDLPKPPEKVETTISLNSQTKGIKILGERALESDSQINLDWTCSGVEFVIDSLGGELTLKAGSNKPCYLRIYVDGIEWSTAVGKTYFEINGETTVTVPSIPAGKHTVRIVKVTGHTLATAQLYSMSYYGTLEETAPADKDVYIEFIGDSISCGWGVIGAHDGSYSAQDGALAYPYMLAKKLNADYSITALSGQGVIFHGTTVPNMTDGYLMSSPLRDNTQAYDFERKANMVVINMGTNDFSKKDGNTITEETFAESYKALINTIREKNGADCKIVCLYNTMNDTFASSIITVCRELGGQKAGIYTFKMTRAASGHPTAEENVAYTNALESVLLNALEGKITESKLDVENAGNGMTVDFSQFKPYEG